MLVNAEDISHQLQELEGCMMISKRYHATDMSMEQTRSPKREWNLAIGMNCIKSERFQPSEEQAIEDTRRVPIYRKADRSVRGVERRPKGTHLNRFEK